ncbi:MAG: DUF4139 domain-containing protein [Treponema sp.]|nr:DUF4139 domain-containing protein [Treponema sp.]
MKKTCFWNLSGLAGIGLASLLCVFSGPVLLAEELPLKQLTLFSSGVGYFVHSGEVRGTPESPARLRAPFKLASVNDALKSLVINDPVSSSPLVRYASADSLRQTLKDLKIDLSGNPALAEILGSLTGEEIEVSAPTPLTGRIVGVEYRSGTIGGEAGPIEPWLSLFTAKGIQAVALKDIASFVFKNDEINADLKRALDLIMASRNTDTKDLEIILPGQGNRTISVSYVIPMPVWKVSYRLDLGGNEPFLQGWAIVDNGSDSDWEGVELSLVTGRPVSFIQNLYPPYYTSRPVIPLAIAGLAQAEAYESGSSWEGAAFNPESAAGTASPMAPFLRKLSENVLNRSAAAAPDEEKARESPAPAPGYSLDYAGTLETAQGRAAGDQFEFTLKQPVTLERRASAMLPLVQGTLQATRALVFSGAKAVVGQSINPSISAELTNTTGMKLPAGPITVYDGGTYAGDALVEFLGENEKRIISYGDDLSVRGTVTAGNTRTLSSVRVANGVMTISRSQNYEKTYTIISSAGEDKRIIIEHPITQGTTLAVPEAYDEKTASLYRFTRPLPAGKELKFNVREERPISEQITLARLGPETFLSYASSEEIPLSIRTALSKAVELRQKADEAENELKNLETRRTRLVSEQDRIRQNLAAAGNQSPQGQEYLKRMAALDADIDNINSYIKSAENLVESSKKGYSDYIAGLKF